MRTLVVSDLHLGARSPIEALRSSAARSRLLSAVREADRLVLLGDVLEFRQGPVREALAKSRDVFEEIGAELGRRQAVLVPGNHDHHLLSGWLARSASAEAPAPLGLQSEVDWRQGEALETMAGWLSPAKLHVQYPGVWLRDDVYATHGHYSDRHTTVPMLERLAAGAMARVVGEPDGGPRGTEDYEATLGPIYAWIHAIAQSEHGGGRPLSGTSARAWRALQARGRGRLQARLRLRRLGLEAAIRLLNAARLGPVSADLSGSELRRAALRAFDEVVSRLGIDARHVIFGHTHRAGPLTRDNDSEWVTARGSRLINCGCWVSEETTSAGSRSTSPYRPGFAVRIDDDRDPQLVNLLDE